MLPCHHAFRTHRIAKAKAKGNQAKAKFHTKKRKVGMARSRYIVTGSTKRQ